MKKLLLILSVSLFAFSSFAQETDSTTAARGRGNNHNSYHHFCPYCHQAIYNSNTSFGCSTPVSNAVFIIELVKLKRQNTVIGKKLVAKRIATSYCLTSNQVYELSNNMFMNADRLELAKFCYANCTDPENYEIVYNAFSSNALVNELHQYITNYVRNNNGSWGNNQDNNSVCKVPMSAGNFESAKKTINNAGFDNTKMEVAKTVISTNCLTTEQVIEICKLFSFEQNKLDFAKLAWERTYDRANFFKVSSVFDFSISKDALNKFIQNGGK